MSQRLRHPGDPEVNEDELPTSTGNVPRVHLSELTPQHCAGQRSDPFRVSGCFWRISFL